jgi:hypothetical protein
VEIELLDLNGRMIGERETYIVDQGTSSIDLSELIEGVGYGIYFVRVISENEAMNLKFVISE